MSRELKTTLTIEAQTRGIDQVVTARAAIDGLGKGATASNPELARLRTTLGELAQQQQLIARFTQLKAALTSTTAELQAAQAAATAAARELRAKQAATQAATAAEQAGAAALQQARNHHEALRSAVALAGAELKQLRATAQNAGGASAELSARIKETQGQLGVLRGETQRAGAQVKALAGEQRQLGAAVREAATAQGGAEKAMARAVATAQSAKSGYEAQRITLHSLRQSLAAAGISSTALSEAQQRLTAAITSTRGAAEAQAQQMLRTVAAKKSMREGIESISSSLARMQRLYMAWIGGNEVVQYVRQLIGVADTYKNIEARIALVNRTTDGFNLTMAETADLARRTYSSLDGTSQLVGALARAGAELGASQETVLRLAETINKANQLSGQSAAAADAAVVQLIQGLQSGVLRGEEFNSMMEQAPRLAQALADGLGVPVSALRAMANEGKLTADVVINALQSQAAAVDAEFSALPQTVGRALTNLSTAWAQFIGALDNGTGTTAAIASALNGLSTVLDTLSGSMDELGTLVRLVATYFGVQAVAHLLAYRTGLIATAVSSGTLAAAQTALATAAKTAWAALATSPAFIIVGLVELARTIDYLATNWDELTEKVRTYIAERKKQREIEQSVEDNAKRLADRYAEISLRTGVTVKSMAELNAAVAAGKIHFDEATASWKAGPGPLNQVVAASKEAAKQLREIGRALQDAGGKFGPVAEAAKAALDKVQQQLDKAKSAAADAVGGMGDAYGGLTELVGAALQAQMAAVKARYEAEAAELDASAASQRTKIEEGARLFTEAVAEQVAAQQAATAETLRLVDAEAAGKRAAATAGIAVDAALQASLQKTLELIDQEAHAQLTAANAAARRGEISQQALLDVINNIGEEVKARKQAAVDEAAIRDERKVAEQRVDNEILATRKTTLEAALDAYQQHVNALNGEINRHLAEVQRIEGEKRGLAQTTEDRIREIRRGGMTDAEALADRTKQIAELQSKSRQALAQGDFEAAKRYGQQAIELATQVASDQTKAAKDTADKQGEYATATRTAKEAVNKAIGDILASERLVQEALTAEGTSHQDAAAKATAARSEIEKAIAETQGQIEGLAKSLGEGLKLTIEADSEKLKTAIAEVDALIEEKTLLVKIDAELKAAQEKLENYQALINKGEELPVDANFDDAKTALQRFGEYAKGKGSIALAVKTEEAEKAVNDLNAKLQGLRDIKTKSQHAIDTNAGAVRSEIDSLNGRNTSSTHTIYVKRVETNAIGGLAGRLLQRFAAGGPAFPLMREGAVPGVGNTDSVPRTLEAGAFVLRKAAVDYYGRSGIADMIKRASAALPAGGAPTASAPELVPALTMPGEEVIGRDVVARLGVTFFEGLNAMKLPPKLEIPRFAEGGSASGYSRKDWGQEAILARAEQIGGLSLRRRIEAEWRAKAKRLPRDGSSQGFKLYWKMMADTVAELDRIQIAQEQGDKWEQAQAKERADVREPAAPESNAKSEGSSGKGATSSGMSSGASERPREIVRIKVDVGNREHEFDVASRSDVTAVESVLRALAVARGVSS